jgi:hypothetical protein
MKAGQFRSIKQRWQPLFKCQSATGLALNGAALMLGEKVMALRLSTIDHEGYQKMRVFNM